jgi:predicted transcriptional regulator of viral defense system
MENLILKILEEHKGYLFSKQLLTRAQHYQLKKMLDNGDIIQLKRGLYRSTQILEADNMGEVCRIIPSGVICLFSAWQFYNLTTHIPSVIHIAVPHKQKIVLPDYPPVKLYYWSNLNQNMATKTIMHLGETITIYDLEKSVCDAVKFRNKVGIDITSEVLKNYLKREDRNLDLLMKYATKLRISDIITQYLNVML